LFSEEISKKFASQEFAKSQILYMISISLKMFITNMATKTLFSKNYISFFLISWKFLLVILLVSHCGLTAHPKAKEIAKYYERLESVADSIDIPLPQLENLVLTFPELERPYLKLLDHAILADKVVEIKDFFEKLNIDPKYQQNSNWMVAKIYEKERNPEAALNAYLSAFRSGSPSTTLISDFVKFDKSHFRKLDEPRFEVELGLDSEERKITRAFYAYRNLDYKQALKIFSIMSKSTRVDPEILYYQGLSHYRLSQYQQADSL